MVEGLLPLFYAICIEGYTETVVPNYNMSEFRSHFRLSVETSEQLRTFDGRRQSSFCLLFLKRPRREDEVTSLFRFIPCILLALGIQSVYSGIRIATQSNEYSSQGYSIYSYSGIRSIKHTLRQASM